MKDETPPDIQTLKNVIRSVSTLHDDHEAVEHLARRLTGEYLPAMAQAQSKDAQNRVWFAFWNYLTSRPTRRKPFALSSYEADDLVGKLQSHLAKENQQ